MKLNTKGFTLVELLGVVAIIAVLATVSITSISGAIQGGREASAKRQIQTLNSAYQNYLAAGGSATGQTLTSINTALQAALPLPNSSQSVGPFLTAPFATTVLNADGDPVTIEFDPALGFNAAL